MKSKQSNRSRSVAEKWLSGHCHKIKESSSSSSEDGGGALVQVDDDDDTTVNNIETTMTSNVSTACDLPSAFYPLDQSDFSAIKCMNDTQRRFYMDEYQQTGLGLTNIVKQAMKSSAQPKDISEQEVSFHLTVCKLCVSLTRSQLRSVGTMVEDIALYYRSSVVQPPDVNQIIAGAQANLKKQGKDELSTEQILALQQSFAKLQQSMQQPIQRGIFKETKPQTNYTDMVRLYLKSKYSIYQNLPIPQVHMATDGVHAYVRLKEIVAGFLGSVHCDLTVPSEREYQNKDITDSYYTSEVAREVYGKSKVIANIHGLNDKCFSMHIKDWADDAQKAQFIITEFGSYNIRTITFMKHRTNGDIRYWTYPVSLGLKGCDHEEVEKYFNDDLLELSRPNLFYSGFHKKFFWATVTLIAGVRDRPARGETFYIGNHNHTFAKRFGWAAYHGGTQPFLPCLICEAARILRLQKKIYVPKEADTYCTICADLDYTSPLLNVDVYTLKKDGQFRYPTKLVPSSPEPPPTRPVNGSEHVTIGPVKLTFEFLKAISEVAFFNYHTLQHMQHLKRNARTARDRSELGSSIGWSQLDMKTYIRTAGGNDYLCSKIINFSAENIGVPPVELHDKFINDVLPATWQRIGVDVYQQLDAVFHLVFHGITMNVWDIYIDAISSIKISGNKSLKSVYKDTLIPVMKALHELQLNDMPVQPFTKSKKGNEYSYGGWIGVHKMAFCFLLPYATSHILYYYKVLSPANKRMTNDQRQTIRRAQLAVFSFTTACTFLLQRKISKTECKLMGEYFKMFLTEIDAVQRTYISASESEKLAYNSTGNFASTLNLEDNTRSHGPTRNFWDANDEKSVQEIKRFWPNVNQSTPTWQRTLLQGVIREKFLNLLWNKKDSEEQCDISDLIDNIHIMDDMTILRYEEVKALPFSGVYHPGTDQFYVVVRDGGRREGKKIFTRKVYVDGNGGTTLGSCPFYPYRISRQKNACQKDQFAHILQDHIPVAFMPFQYHLKDKNLNEQVPKVMIISINDHKVYFCSGFVIPLLSHEDIGKHFKVAVGADVDNDNDDHDFKMESV